MHFRYASHPHCGNSSFNRVFKVWAVLESTWTDHFCMSAIARWRWVQAPWPSVRTGANADDQLRAESSLMKLNDELLSQKIRKRDVSLVRPLIQMCAPVWPPSQLPAPEVSDVSSLALSVHVRRPNAGSGSKNKSPYRLGTALRFTPFGNPAAALPG